MSSVLTRISRWAPDGAKRPVKRMIRYGRSLSRLSLPRVFLNSIPKSGTHLLEGILDQLGFRLSSRVEFNPDMIADYNTARFHAYLRNTFHGEYLIEHLPWQPDAEAALRSKGLKVIFVYRDPRAMALSNVHWVARRSYHRLHPHYMSLPGVKERLMAELNGTPGEESTNGIGRSPLAALYDQFLPWKKSPLVYSIAFEEIVGERGGGDDEKQKAALSGLLRHLGREDIEGEAARLSGSLYNESANTFRKGRIDSWREEMDHESAAIMTARLATQLTQWGYQA